MDQELSVSNSRLILTLPAHSASTYSPGSLILPRVTVKGNYSSLKITLFGMTLSRLLVGTLSYVVNDPLVTTNMERDVFLQVEATLLSGSNPSAEVDRKTSTATGDNIKGGIYELRIPRNLGVLPSLKMFDYSGEAEVKYYLEVKGTRKGMFASNDRLVLEIKMSMPLPTPSPRSLLAPQWPSATASNDLKFKTSHGDPIQISAKLSHRPAITVAQDIMFTLNLTCPEAEHVLTSPPPIITAYISRILLSRETDAVTLSRLTKTILKGSISYKSGEWTGVVSIAATEKSVEGRKLMCRYTLTCEIKSDALASGEDFKISIPIFLPSSDQVLPSARDAPPAFEGDSDLPVYSA